MLQMVVSQGAGSMQKVLGWEADRTAALVQACKDELEGRLQQVQALKSLSVQSQQAGDTITTENTNQTKAKRRK